MCRFDIMHNVQVVVIIRVLALWSMTFVNEKLQRSFIGTGTMLRAAISMSSGTAIPWVDKIRYLGVFIARSHVFRCDLDHAKNRFIAPLTQFLEKLVVLPARK